MTPGDAFHQFGTDPEKRSGLELLQKLVGDKHGHAGAEESGRRALEFLKHLGGKGIAAENGADCRGEVLDEISVTRPQNRMCCDMLHALAHIFRLHGSVADVHGTSQRTSCAKGLTTVL